MLRVQGLTPEVREISLFEAKRGILSGYLT